MMAMGAHRLRPLFFVGKARLPGGEMGAAAMKRTEKSGANGFPKPVCCCWQAEDGRLG